jgi:hypothetical protein
LVRRYWLTGQRERRGFGTTRFPQCH